VIIIMLVPLAALVTKRLNDADRSRWPVIPVCLLLLAMVTVTFAIYNTSLGQAHRYLACAVDVALFGAWFWLLFFIERLPSG
jgi:uncharacterized membrane protein YhaH (DUF805 family)